MAAGVVVCGGGSTRFGDADKVCAELDGRPLVRHVADRIAPVVEELVVSCRAPQVDCIEAALEGYELPVTYVFDAEADAGPLHGIKRGLSATDAEYTVVVACDMPFVDTEFLATLFERAQDHEVAIPRQGEGKWYQPLQAVYRVEPMLEAIEAAFEENVSRPIKPALALDHVTVEGADLEAVASDHTFFNVNTREDLERAENLLAGEEN